MNANGIIKLTVVGKNQKPMKKFKKWWKQFWCSHLWKVVKIDMLKRIETHPLDDVKVLYAVSKICLKCGKTTLVGEWHRELPAWMKKDIKFKT